MRTYRFFMVVFCIIFLNPRVEGQAENETGASLTEFTTADPCPPILDVAFVLDTSGSVERVYEEHVRWTLALSEVLPLSREAVRLAVIQYAGTPITEFSLSTYSSADSVRKHLKKITFESGVTRTGYALRRAQSELFREDKGARSNADKLLILFSDGLSIDDPVKTSEKLRLERNVTIFVASVGGEGFMTEMERIAGDHENLFGPSDLEKLKQRVLEEVENSRICNDGQRLVRITSTTTTTTVPTKTTTTVTKQITTALNSSSRLRLSTVRSKRQKLNSKLKATTFAQVKPLLMLPRPQTPQLNLSSLQLKLRSQLQPTKTPLVTTTTSHSRNVTQVPSTTPSKEPSTRKTARPWKNPARSEKKTLPVSIKSSKGEGRRSNVSTTTVRNARADSAGKNNGEETSPSIARGRAFGVRSQPEIRKVEEDCPNDVLFVVDSSGSAQRIYDIQKRFLASLIEEIDVSTSANRIGLIQFSGRQFQKIEWSFDQIHSNRQLMEAFSKVRLFTGTTYIGAALNRAKSLLAARRPDTPTLLILLSDGFSHDDVEVPAEEVRNLTNVDVYATSVSPLSNMRILLQITEDPQRVFAGERANEIRDILRKRVICSN